MTKALLMFIGGGVLSALLYLSVVTGGMGALILAYLAPLPLLMVGLGAGFRSFVIASPPLWRWSASSEAPCSGLPMRWRMASSWL